MSATPKRSVLRCLRADRVWTPVTDAPPLSMAASAGYGVTESQAGEGAHHRVEGTLAAAVGLTPNIAASLGFNGRYDIHPRISAIAARSVTPQLGLVGGVHAADRASASAPHCS